MQDYVVFRFFKMFEMICITSHHAFNLQETLAGQAPTGTPKDEDFSVVWSGYAVFLDELSSLPMYKRHLRSRRPMETDLLAPRTAMFRL